MTPFDQSVIILHIAINVVVFWFVWHGPWRRACQERYRQKLFEVRDELFDFARNGGIGFDDPAYVALRSHINGMMRFSHLISVTRLATFILFRRYIGELPPPGYPSLSNVLSEISDKERKAVLMAFRDKVRAHTTWHLLFASPHVLIAGPPLYLLDSIMSPCTVKGPPSSSQQHSPAAIGLIEVQARDAYRSEAMRRHHDRELASVS